MVYARRHGVSEWDRESERQIKTRGEGADGDRLVVSARQAVRGRQQASKHEKKCVRERERESQRHRCMGHLRGNLVWATVRDGDSKRLKACTLRASSRERERESERERE